MSGWPNPLDKLCGSGVYNSELTMEEHKRTILKTITWRIIAVLVTMVIVYLYNKDIRESIIISLAANAIKMFLYYIHERMWNKTNFGRKKPPEYQI